MNIFEIILISIGLGMDAMSVAICKGLAMKKFDVKKTLIIALYFGIFQFLMPVIGFFIGARFEKIIDNVSHWIAFAILAVIGINMIRECFKKEDKNENKIEKDNDKDNDNKEENDKVDFKTMIVLAIATSIDALVVGISFAMMKVNIWTSSTIIGIITFLMSIVGALIGKLFKEKLKIKPELLGGIILILIGIKIVIEHYI